MSYSWIQKLILFAGNKGEGISRKRGGKEGEMETKYKEEEEQVEGLECLSVMTHFQNINSRNNENMIN